MPFARKVRRLRHPGPRLLRYEPRPTLAPMGEAVFAATHPAIDCHSHLGRWLTPDGGWMAPDVGALLAAMDQCNLSMLVNLDGRWGDELEENLARYDHAHPGRFVTFCHLDWSMLDASGGPDQMVKSLEASAQAGAGGLKVWKDLGLTLEVQGRRLLPDDRMLDPVWEAAGALGLPVLAHVADPVAFFQPVDRRNERLEELLRHPSVSQSHLSEDAHDRILDAFEATVGGHPGTTFVGAHVGCYAENLSWVSGMLDRYPNFWIDTASLAELGRQPRTAARLINSHPDRVVFGADVFPFDADIYRRYFRLFETDDDFFASSSPGDVVAPRGRWPIYGLGLESDVLRGLYHANARRLLGLRSEDGNG